MYVCICNAVSDRDISRAVSDGAGSLDDLRSRLRVSTGCGACADEATQCLERCREQMVTCANTRTNAPY
ncbi:MAG: bacterioferritin-associated ferredoxin [Gammaproteobacteria bacterium]